ncbi:NosD domain-containing protein [Halobaculum rubrum]|uniref:NosD domain-containing protein n=1 Tax=Halobaculum rubrum TaxID=2872158 RepID=UPI001CA42F7F|nr:NosD domain-containing protein [Halobaculum rubrum]QZX99079.1 right-handed parallel beta-helix repeat-containing protein [Halobaculum rubrum]
MYARTAVVAVALSALVLGSSFAVPIGAGNSVDPVPFDDTVSLGMTSTTLRAADADGVTLPKVEAFYAEYEYVIGYYGIESYLAEHRRTGHDRQFGQPLAVFVTDYAGTNVSLTDRGYPVVDADPSFVRAEDTYVVVGSDARTATGSLAMPFSDRGTASSFAERYGGEVVPWERVDEAVDASSPITRERYEATVDERTQWADRAVDAARSLRDRPVSVTVGEEEPTLRAALAAAPPNTTIRLPPGEYAVDEVAVNTSVTISGAGAATHIRGDGNGSVLHVNASRVAVTDLRISGVGSVGSPERSVNASSDWSSSVELAYGRGDAAIRLDGADGALVENVVIDTPASGVITRAADGAVVRNITLRGAATPDEGFMGVVAMYEPIVVENSSFTGGRDAVYTHRAHGTVVRHNELADGRFGVHLMYTSRTLVANNEIRNESVGVIIMTRPTGNLVVGNHVSATRTGISTVGSDSYYAENVLTDNKWGMTVSGTGSLYTRNTIVDNTYGLRGSSLLPTNHVTHNDVIGNDHPVDSDLGALRVWTVADEGNYWGALPGEDRDGDGALDRPYRPTGPIDGRLHSTPGAWTLARSPAVTLTRGLGSSVPGLRATGVVDTAPLTAPVRPAAITAARTNGSDDRTGTSVDDRNEPTVDAQTEPRVDASGAATGVST